MDRSHPTDQKRIVANAMAKAVADMLARWNEKTTGVPAGFAANAAASYLNYAPVTEWDPRLPERSGAGGRRRRDLAGRARLPYCRAQCQAGGGGCPRGATSARPGPLGRTEVR